MDNEPEQAALFHIEGPDEKGCVWICSAEGRAVLCHNLGPLEAAVAEIERWLASIHWEERER